MSIEAMAWALRQPLGGTKKILLVGLANHATAEFDHARPSVQTLAVYADCHPRNVQKALRELEADGWIARTGEHPLEGRRDRSVTIYRLCQERGGAGVAPLGNGVALASERGGAGAANGVAVAPPDPSLGEPSIEPSDTAREDLPSSMTFRGRRVPRPVVDVAARSVRYFALKTGQTLRVVDGTGRASTSMQRVVGAMLAHPELAEAEFARRTIDFALAAPWWRDEGPPGVGVVFGPNVVERMVEQARRDEPPSPRSSSGGRQSASDLLRMLAE